MLYAILIYDLDYFKDHTQNIILVIAKIYLFITKHLLSL